MRRIGIWVALAVVAFGFVTAPHVSAATGFLSKFGTLGTGDGQLDTPRGIAMTAAGKIVVADQFNDRIQILEPDGTFISKFGSTGTGQDQFQDPSGIAVLPNGNFAIGDTGNARVKIVQPDGTFVASFGNGVDPNPLTGPRGITYDPFQNTLLIADAATGKVQRRTLDGAFVSEVTGLSAPNDVAVQTDGDFLVADFGNDRIREFSPAGVFKTDIGTGGIGLGQLDAPTGVDIAPNGDIWVAESNNNRVQRFSPGGTGLEVFGTVGTGDGQFTTPRTLFSDHCGNVFVTDTANDRVQRVGEPGTPLSCAAPDTTITSGRRRTRDRTPTFTFTSSAAASTFQCSIDGRAFTTCRSPFTTTKLKRKKHTLRVQSVFGGVIIDPTPATKKFRILPRS